MIVCVRTPWRLLRPIVAFSVEFSFSSGEFQLTATFGLLSFWTTDWALRVALVARLVSRTEDDLIVEAP